MKKILSLALLVLAGASSLAHAQGFSALVTPPRFEDRVQAGQTYRNVIEITNVSGAPSTFFFKTNDWVLNREFRVDFSDDIAANSCRPWVALESRQVTIAPNGKKRFRFEVAVPKDAPVSECRFAIMVGGDPQATKGDLSVPVAGRIGVIVYLAIGGAKPQLEMKHVRAETVDGVVVPVLEMTNSGTAHGRLGGFVEGTDASGRKFTFAPSSFPILPGETRKIGLIPEGEGDQPAPAIQYPLKLKGHAEWVGGKLDLTGQINGP